MDPITAAALIGAGSNLLGGLLGQSSADKTRDLQAQQLATQRLYAEHGLAFKAKDAREAGEAYGFSPLALLGVQGASASPVQVGDVGNPLGEAIGKAGQDVGRAAAANTSQARKQALLDEKLLDLKLQQAQNDVVHGQLVNSQLARTLAPVGGPPGVNVPFPPPDPRGPVQRLTSRYITDRGEIVHLPSAAASQSAQNLFAAPGGVPMAVDLLRANTAQAGSDLANWYTVRPDVWRGVDTSQYVPF